MKRSDLVPAKQPRSKPLDAPLDKADGNVWLDENREPIDEYNVLVAKRGVFSDGRRRF